MRSTELGFSLGLKGEGISLEQVEEVTGEAKLLEKKKDVPPF